MCTEQGVGEIQKGWCNSERICTSSTRIEGVNISIRRVSRNESPRVSAKFITDSSILYLILDNCFTSPQTFETVAMLRNETRFLCEQLYYRE